MVYVLYSLSTIKMNMSSTFSTEIQQNMFVIFVSNGTPSLINSIILPLYFNSNFMHITVVFRRLLKFLFSLYFTS